ncbi:MAG: hypothetical protein ACP5E5_03320 [Acidobacteriaceae bacterium]
MKKNFLLRLLSVIASAALFLLPVAVSAQEPPAIEQMIRNLAPQPSNHTAFTFDHNMLQVATGFLDDGEGPPMQLDSITVENYRYAAPAFYVPEAMHALVATLDAAGWKHLVSQHAAPPAAGPDAAQGAAPPRRNLTDLWLHFTGMDIDNVLVVVRSPRQMSVVEVTGDLRPLDLIHLSGHFGIPKVDPDAVMVPAPPGK